MTDSKRSITVEDLYKFQIVSEARISPDGRHVVFVAQRVHQKTEKKYTNLWLASSDGKSCRQFTQGDQNDSLPRWSPDGQTIAFVSNREDEKQSQVFLIPWDGGEAAKLTELEGSTRALEWSPDGESLLLNFRSKDAEAVEREKDSQKKELGVVSRHITRLFYKADGSGYVPEERWHIWTVDTDSGEATQLTEGEFDENTPTWSPDGKTILFASNRHEDPDAHLDAVELYTIPAGGGELTQIETGHDKSKSNPVYSPDGEWIAYLGRRLSGSFYQNTCLYLIPAAGGEARNLTEEHDLHISSSTINDVGGSPPASPPQWSPDGKRIYIQVTRQGNQPILAVSPFPEVEIAPVLEGKGVHGAFSLDESGQQMAYFHATLTDPGQMWHLDLGNGEKTQLTHLNSWLDDICLGEVEETWLESEDGSSIHTWIFTPPDHDPAQTYPAILSIHGGPQTQYGNFFFHESRLLATNGYIVFGSNPRGSQGYGEAYAGAIHNQWGSVDFQDLMTVADAMVARQDVDETRTGVSGGSYGGWMTTTILGRTNRFKAAVAQRVVSNWFSFYGASDLTYAAGILFGGGEPYDNPEDYLRQSPIFHLKDASTPTLVIHSEQDYRTPQEQSEQLYITLKRLGIETELVLFPGESHGLSRGGRTDRRIVRLNHILRWMDRYLKAEEENV